MDVMQDFTEIEELIGELERGELTAPEAIAKLDEAWQLLNLLAVKLYYMARDIRRNPNEVNEIRTRFIQTCLFSKVE